MNYFVWTFFILLSLYQLIRGKVLTSILTVNFTVILLKIFGENIYYWDFCAIFTILFTLPKINLFIRYRSLLVLIIFLFLITTGLLLNFEFVALKEYLRWIEIISVFFVVFKYYENRKIENDFLISLGFLLITNLIVNFFQINNNSFAYSLKSTGNIGTLGGFFNDSSEIGPIFLLSASLFHELIKLRKNIKLNNFYFFISIFGVVISSNRTSLVLASIILLFRLFDYRIKTSLPFLITFSFISTNLIRYSAKNFQLIMLIFSNPQIILSEGTFNLRFENWLKILDVFHTQCNRYLGCGLAYFDFKRDLYSPIEGMFAVDNAYIRILTSHGYIGSIFFAAISIFFISKVKMNLFKFNFLFLGLTIEAIKSLPIFIFVSTIFIFTQKIKIFNESKKSELD